MTHICKKIKQHPKMPHKFLSMQIFKLVNAKNSLQGNKH
jgi:hypothetical protein